MHTSRILYEAPHLDQLITLESAGLLPKLYPLLPKIWSFKAVLQTFQELHDFESKMSKKKKRKNVISVPSMICVQCSYFNEINHKHTKKVTKKPTKQKCKKKKSLLLTGCFVSMFLVCTFLVFILIVQLKLESCNEQKK